MRLSAHPSQDAQVSHSLEEPHGSLFHACPTRAHFFSFKEALEHKVEDLLLSKTTGAWRTSTWIGYAETAPIPAIQTLMAAALYILPMDHYDEAVAMLRVGNIEDAHNMNWCRASFIGMNIDGDHSDDLQFHVEFHVKRIAGADRELMKACGIHPNAFISLSHALPARKCERQRRE